jgi:hypothetical protein
MYYGWKTFCNTFYIFLLCILAFSYISYYSTLNTWKFKSSVEVYPIDFTHRCMMQRGVKPQFRQPYRIWNQIRKILGYESGAQGLLVKEKTEVENLALLSVSILRRREYKFKTVQFSGFPLKFFDVQALFSSALQHCNELFLKNHAFTLTRVKLVLHMRDTFSFFAPGSRGLRPNLQS